MQRAENKKIFKKAGITDDIVQQVIKTFQKDYLQCAEIANELRGQSNIETYENIFNYIIKNVEYVADPSGVQWIKTPARLIADGKGDCKSMAIFTASCLRCLNIDCYFRFVSFQPNKIPTHVYIVTTDGTIIDPVERVNGQPKFNYAQVYTFKIDIMNTTNIYELRGIGNVNDINDVWTGEKSFLENSVAENYLYSEIECALTYLSVEPTPALFNNCDTAAIALQLLKGGYDNEKGAYLLQALADTGLFENQSTDEQTRIEHFDKINVTLKEIISSGIPENRGKYFDWYMNEIIAQHTTEGRDSRGISEYIAKVKAENPEIGGTTQTIQNQLIAKLQQSGWGFLYILTTSSWFRAASVNFPEMQRKYNNEQSLFNTWSVALKKYLNEATIKNNMRIGFIRQTGQTPERYIELGIKAGGLPSAPNIGVVQLAAAVVAAIIAAVTQIVLAIIGLIMALVQKSMKNPNNFPGDVPPNNPDYLSGKKLEEVLNSGSGSSNNKSIMQNNSFLIIAAIAAFFLFKK